jgi:hypothetical protein
MDADTWIIGLVFWVITVCLHGQPIQPSNPSLCIKSLFRMARGHANCHANGPAHRGRATASRHQRLDTRAQPPRADSPEETFDIANVSGSGNESEACPTHERNILAIAAAPTGHRDILAASGQDIPEHSREATDEPLPNTEQVPKNIALDIRHFFLRTGEYTHCKQCR